MVLLSKVQSVLGQLSMTKPVTLQSLCGLLSAAKNVKRIVEELDGSMTHGTWRDDHATRLKDTPEWIAFYNAISDAERGHGSHYYSLAESAWDEADACVAKSKQDVCTGGNHDSHDLDGTEAAHPAWWRGNDAGVLGAVRVITRALEKGECSETGDAALSELIKRVVSTQSDLRWRRRS